MCVPRYSKWKKKIKEVFDKQNDICMNNLKFLFEVENLSSYYWKFDALSLKQTWYKKSIYIG